MKAPDGRHRHSVWNRCAHTAMPAATRASAALSGSPDYGEQVRSAAAIRRSNKLSGGSGSSGLAQSNQGLAADGRGAKRARGVSKSPSEAPRPTAKPPASASDAARRSLRSRGLVAPSTSSGVVGSHQSLVAAACAHGNRKRKEQSQSVRHSGIESFKIAAV